MINPSIPYEYHDLIQRLHVFFDGTESYIDETGCYWSVGQDTMNWHILKQGAYNILYCDAGAPIYNLTTGRVRLSSDSRGTFPELNSTGVSKDEIDQHIDLKLTTISAQSISLGSNDYTTVADVINTQMSEAADLKMKLDRIEAERYTDQNQLQELKNKLESLQNPDKSLKFVKKNKFTLN